MTTTTCHPLSNNKLPETYSRRFLNSLYREIPLKDPVFRLLRKYFAAMANLYGCISLGEAFDIITAQNPSLLTKEAFLSFAQIAQHECEGYCILSPDNVRSKNDATSAWRQILVDRTIVEDGFGLYCKLIHKQTGITFYTPEKPHFLRYEDPFYYEETLESKNLLEYLQNATHSTNSASDVFSEILYGIRYLDADFIMIQKRLHEMGIETTSENDYWHFAHLYQRFYAVTRNQSYRGHTPEELNPALFSESVSFPSPFISIFRKAVENGTVSTEELKKSILTMQYSNEADRYAHMKEIAALEAEIGRKTSKSPIGKNHPCPCGSGKKYKHCCGKT